MKAGLTLRKKKDLTAKERAYRKGLAAELRAAAYLWMRGYRIVAMRYKTSVGEVDLIARRGGVIVFVEVKARESAHQALAAVSPRNRMRVERAALAYLAAHPSCQALQPRFDVIAVTQKGPLHGRRRIHHLDNAWQPQA
jgi:putative endonuclease